MQDAGLSDKPRLLAGGAGALALAAPAVLAPGLGSTAASAPAPTAHTVSVFAPRGVSNNCTRVLPLKRTVLGPRLLQGAIRALLTGPTKAERARGYGGWFSAKTARHLRSVRVSGGVAYVDFRSFASQIPKSIQGPRRPPYS